MSVGSIHSKQTVNYFVNDRVECIINTNKTILKPCCLTLLPFCRYKKINHCAVFVCFHFMFENWIIASTS